MENRFGIKDFLLFLLVVALLVSVWLAMKQYDRQWDRVVAIDARLESQQKTLREIQASLASGVLTRATTPGATTVPSNLTDPAFARMAAARAMPGYTTGDWLVEGLGGRLATITPIVSGDSYAARVQENITENLLTRDPVTLEWSGQVARSWKIEDNSKAWDAYVTERKKVPLTEAEIRLDESIPEIAKEKERVEYIKKRLADGRTDEEIGLEKDAPPAITITFTLRDDVKFSDGEPLTVDDVVFSYDFIMDPKINAPRQRAYYKTVRKVEKVAPDQVRFEFAVPYFQSLELAAGMDLLPKHRYSKMSPEDFNKSTGLLFGSGPYRLPDAGWKPGDQLELVRNDRYWGLSPSFDKVVFREFTNDVARLTAFRNGDVDTFTCFPEQYNEMKADAKLVARTQHYEYTSPTGGYRYVAWNQQRGGKPTAFADKRVRQAMTMLIDRDRLIQEVMLGYAAPATGPFNPLSKQCNPDIKPWPFDPAAASKLLADAGYADPSNTGILTGPDGQPFRFKLTYPSGNPNYERMALAMKDMLARGKVKLDPDPLEWSVFTTRLENKDFDAITLAWSAGIESDIYQMFHSSQMVAGGDDFMSYKSDELDRTIVKARRTVDPSVRIPLWRQAHAILHEDQPYTFLFFPKTLVFLDGRFQNVQLLARGLNPREEWYVPKGQQRWTR